MHQAEAYLANVRLLTPSSDLGVGAGRVEIIRSISGMRVTRDHGVNPQVVWTNGTLASLAVGAFVSLVTPWFENTRDYERLELDGNRQLVSVSQQPEYMMRGQCTHFRAEDLGDPFRH
jgi:hypothetical protein